MPDVPGNTSSTIIVTVGTPLTNIDTNIETAYEQDWYRVSLTGGLTYTIRMMGKGTGANTLDDPMIDGIYIDNGANNNGTYQIGQNGTFNNDGLISGPYGRDAMITFRPPGTVAANYWIATAGDLGRLGTYTISVTNSSGATDSVLATILTTSVVTVGAAAVTGTIDNPIALVPDVDWYRVALTAGITYTINLRGLTSGSGLTLADPVINGVYDSLGNYIVNTYVDDLGTRDPSLTLVAPTPGNYYIAAAGWTTYTGTFSLDVAVATADIAGNTGTSATLAIGANTIANFGQPYDHDWYRVTLTGGTTYQFTLAGTGANNTPAIHGIFSTAGNYVGSYAAAILGPGTASATTIFTPLTTGSYYIDAYSLYEGTYTLSAAAVAADVPANLSTTATVAVNGSVNGDIGGATDIDWYGVSLVAGTTYVIRMQGSQSGMGTLVDPMIAGIFNAAGTVVANTFSDDSDGNEPSLTFRPASSGTYYIAADGYAGYTGSYRLSVTSIPGDVGQTTATATSVALNTPTVVTIDDASDTDWYSVALTGGSTYGIRLQGAATQRGTIYDPVLLGVYDSAGTLVPNTWVDDARGLLNAMLSFTPATSGTYYVAADGYDRFTGTMKLAVTIDNIGITNVTAGSFAVGTPAEGTIDSAGDADRYAIALTLGDTFYIRMLGLKSRNGDLVDPTISSILNAAGVAQTITIIADSPAGTIGNDAWVKLVPAATATYYVNVSEGAGTLEGAFLLTAEKDIPAGTTTTATVLVDGSVTGLIGEGTDNDWYSVALLANTSYVIKMLGVDSGNGTLPDPNIDGVRLSTTSTTRIAGTFGTGTTVDNAVLRDSVARLIPAANGTYYIVADSTSSEMGSFVLSVAIEPGNTVLSASLPAWALTVGGSLSGMIDDTTDADWHKIPLLANTGYLFKMLGVDSAAGTLDDPLITTIRNSTGVTQGGLVLASVGMDSYAHFVSTTAGDYYIEAQGAGTDNGTFRLTAELEAGNTVLSAWSIAVGGSVTGTINSSTDTDWYSVALLANTSYVIKMLGVDSANGTLANPFINGIRLASTPTVIIGGTNGAAVDDAAGRDSVARLITGATGATPVSYIINAQSSGGTLGTFALNVAIEAGSTNASALAITVGSSLVGAIDDATDIDWYAVTLAAGTRYRVRMEGLDSGQGTLADPWLDGVHTSAGAIITTSTGSAAAAEGGGTGRDAYLIFTNTTAGTYYIYADATPAIIGTYKLSVELWPL